MSDRAYVAAEWEGVQRTLMAYPYRDDEWAFGLAEAQAAWLRLAQAIAEAAPLSVVVPDASFRSRLARALPAGIDLAVLPYGDAWVRDTAPMIRRDGSAVAFRFNGWGEKYSIPGDAAFAEHVANHFGTQLHRLDLIGEGGAIEMDGRGCMLTTRSVWTNDNRGAQSEAQVEAVLRAALGARHISWLDAGLDHDHTDGHIDNIMRILPSGAWLTMSPGGNQVEALQRCQATLASWRARGELTAPAVILPAPASVSDPAGELLPASYCNFVYAADRVLVPTFGVPEDDAALDALRTALPGHTVEGLDALPLLYGGGAFHCLTMNSAVT